MIVGVVVVVVVLAAIPLAGKLMQEDGDAAEQSAEPAASTPASGSTSTAAPAPAAAGAPALNTATLTNTKWMMKVQGFDVSFTLLPGGQAVAESPLLEQLTKQKQAQGAWSVSGVTLTVSVNVMGNTESATAVISGNNLLVDGQPITRLQ